MSPRLKDGESPSVRDFAVAAWRFDCLTRAGFPPHVAIDLAERMDVDLHLAIELLERGASVDQVLRILL